MKKIIVEYHGALWNVLVESGWITIEVSKPDIESGSRSALMEKLKGDKS